MSSIDRCDNCGKDNFRWDGQHLICKSCGMIKIREVVSAADRAKTLRELEEAAERKRKEKEKTELKARKRAASLKGHYDRMKSFEEYLSDVGYVDRFGEVPRGIEAPIAIEFKRRESDDMTDALRYMQGNLYGQLMVTPEELRALRVDTI